MKQTFGLHPELVKYSVFETTELRANANSVAHLAGIMVELGLDVKLAKRAGSS